LQIALDRQYTIEFPCLDPARRAQLAATVARESAAKRAAQVAVRAYDGEDTAEEERLLVLANAADVRFELATNMLKEQTDNDYAAESRLRSLEAGFRSKSTARCIPGVVGALDGLLVRIECPSNVPDSLRYWNRKGFYALNVQAIADSDRRILHLSIRDPGSTHDSVAWERDPLFEKLEAGGLPDDLHITADAAYSSSSQASYLLTPYVNVGGHGISAQQDAFNFYQSQQRINVEVPILIAL